MNGCVVIAISATIFSCSCVGNDHDSRKNGKNSELGEITSSGDTNEGFNSFINKISVDSVFQRSRIKFPIILREADNDDSGYRVSNLRSGEWAFMNFQHIDGLEREVLETGNHEASIRYYDPEVAFEVIYIFRPSLGEWYLEEIVDNSN